MGLPQLPDALPIPKGVILYPEKPYFISPERLVMRIELCFTFIGVYVLPTKAMAGKGSRGYVSLIFTVFSTFYN